MSDAPDKPAPPVAARFKPGKSGNPTGRPLGFAKMIKRRTRGGRELIEFALKVLRGEESAASYNMLGKEYQRKPSMKERLQALEYLSERLLGKAPQGVELSGPEGGPLQAKIEVHDVGTDKLAAIVAVLERAGALPAGGATAQALESVDAEADALHSAPADPAPDGGASPPVP